MARNRVIYQSEGVFAGQRTPCTGVNHTGAADVKEIYRVQSANYSFNLGKRDVNQFGELAAIDRILVDPPTVSLDFTYLLANVYNEQALGMTVGISTNPTSNAFSGIFAGATDEKAYWVKTVAYGTDLHGLPSTGYVFGAIGFGNGYISSYSIDAAVGDFPRASVRVDCSNMKFDNWLSTDEAKQSPCVNKENGTLIAADTYRLPSGTSTTSALDQTTVLRPGDVVMTWDNAAAATMGTAINDAKIQSFTLSSDISKTPLNKLGSKFAYSQETNFPVTASLRITAAVGDMNTGSLTQLLESTGVNTVGVKIFAPTGSTVNFGFDLKGAQLDSQEYSSSIGDSKTVTMNFSVPIAGANDLTRGIFLSGRV